MFIHIQGHKLIYLYEYKEEFIQCGLSPQIFFSHSSNHAKVEITVVI